MKKYSIYYENSPIFRKEIYFIVIESDKNSLTN